MAGHETADEFSVRRYFGALKGLLGFALKRKEADGEWETMRGMLHFPKFAAAAGKLIPTNQAPIRKFR